MTPRHAIVTDGLWRKSLSAIRSLGKAGWRVTVLGDSLLTTGQWSRWCSRAARGSLASTDPELFLRRLSDEIERCSTPPVLLPMEEASLLAMVRDAHRLQAPHRILVPGLSELELAIDKGATMRHANRHGVPTPWTRWPGDPTELWSEVEACPNPEFVLKPIHGSGSAGVRYLQQGELSEKDCEEHWQRFGPTLLQERIPAVGRAIGVSQLWGGDGALLASFTHERTQQYPVTGGPSTDRKSIHHEELEEHSTRLLQSLDWKGVAMVEWKEDPHSRRFVLMEINPRWWGSLELAVRSGVDFPRLYAEAALGEAPPPVLDYELDVRCRWLFGDLLRYLSHGKEREPLRSFRNGLLRDSEEWDPTDKRGFVASFACKGLLGLHPKYWRYLKRS